MYDILIESREAPEGISDLRSPEDLVSRIHSLCYKHAQEDFFQAAHSVSAEYFQAHPEQYAAFQDVAHHVAHQNDFLPHDFKLFLEVSVR